MISGQQAPSILTALLLAGCAQTPDTGSESDVAQLGLTEPPYFPECVLREEGTFHQRRLDRTSYFNVETRRSEPLDDSCRETEP
jgi:hypothetical protein